jgi:predicted ArsR family transcriptional regulator
MDAKDFERQVQALGVLDEPVRRRLFRLVERRGELSRDQAARAAGVSRALAAFHLDKLVEAGLLEAGFRRLSGRSGPGAGRPSKLYRRSALELDVTLPQRRYEWAAQVLARALGRASSPATTDALRDAARAHGESIGRDLRKPASDAPALRAATQALTACGFDPALAPAGQLVLRNCPFASLREGCRDVVCGMNLALIEGVLGGLGVEGVTAALEPQPETCCVALRAADGSTPSRAPAPGPEATGPAPRRRT